MTDPLAAFERERGRLFGVAYRMLSSVSEAEDVLQDAWLRWQAVDPATVENPSAFLLRTVIDRRARQKLSGTPRPRPADPEEHDRLLYGFLQASREGDMQGMLNLLARDAVCISDGGGKAHAAKVPLVGAERVARFLSGLQAKAQVPFEVRLAQVNGRTGFITYVEGRIANVGSFRIEDGLIREIFIQVNPEKLPERTGPQAMVIPSSR